MQLNPLSFSQQAIKPPQPLATPTAQAAVVTASLLSQQQPASATRTQTAQAPQAAGKADSTRSGQSGTDTTTSKDTLASAVTARTNGTGYGSHFRGSRLDVSV